MAKGEPKKRATDPVVAAETAATLTREELAGAIRTLVAMAACWELRDECSTVTDERQAKRLQTVVRLLREAANAQTESAQRIMTTIVRDELAVAMGAKTEFVTDVIVTSGADTGKTTQESEISGSQAGEPRPSTRPLGFREVLVGRRTKSSGLPDTLWSEAAQGVPDGVGHDLLASAIRRCHWTAGFIMGTGGEALKPEDAVSIADSIRKEHKKRKQGVMQAAAQALYLFRARDLRKTETDAGDASKALHNKISMYLSKERHPDRIGLDNDSVDTGRFFGARDFVLNPESVAANVAPIALAVVNLVGDALDIHREARETLWSAIRGGAWPGSLTGALRGGGFRVQELGIDSALRVLTADWHRRQG